MPQKWIGWLQIVLIFIVIGVIGYVGIFGFRAVTEPVVQLRQDLSTQVSKLVNPTPTIIPDPVTIIREVRALARLETIQYSVEKIIVAETGQGAFGFLVGDRLLFVAHGLVIAGVDLGKIGPDTLWLDEMGRVYLSLPAAEVFVTALDNEKSYIYDRERGLLTRGDINLETEARQAAEAEILNAAMEDGILEQAAVNAENYLYAFLRSLGFPDVIFVQEGQSPQGVNTQTPMPLSTP